MDDIKWFLGVLFLLGVGGYLLGAVNPGSGSLLSNPSGFGGVYSRAADKNHDGVIDENEAIADEVGKVERELENIQDELQKAQEAAESSRYRGLVTLQASGARGDTADEEYVIIRVSSQAKAPIPITGFSLESPVNNRHVTIGGAAALPRSGDTNTETPVMIPPGGIAYITTGRSPTGWSFRTNICTGYFEQFQDFRPSLKKQCPLAKDEATLTVGGDYPDACFDYIERLPRCSIQTGATPEGIGYRCAEFVTSELNYNSCVSAHKGDVGFYENEWRIYLKHEFEIWRNRREIIKLLDQNGKIVDVVTY